MDAERSGASRRRSPTHSADSARNYGTHPRLPHPPNGARRGSRDPSRENRDGSEASTGDSSRNNREGQSHANSNNSRRNSGGDQNPDLSHPPHGMGRRVRRPSISNDPNLPHHQRSSSDHATPSSTVSNKSGANNHNNIKSNTVNNNSNDNGSCINTGRSRRYSIDFKDNNNDNYYRNSVAAAAAAAAAATSGDPMGNHQQYPSSSNHPKSRRHKRSTSGYSNYVNRVQKQPTLSSSDDEVKSTPDYTSADDLEIESESLISERGEFDQESATDDSWGKDEVMADKIKKFLKHPVAWQPAADDSYLIGHMTLKKGTAADDKKNAQSNLTDTSTNPASSAILGLKVVGGKPLHAESGGGSELAAFITKVKRGSIADTVGHLIPGDQVLEWNGQSLNGLTFEQVSEIIVKSKSEPQVELIVLRKIDRDKMGGVGTGGGSVGVGGGGSQDGDTNYSVLGTMKGVYDISGQAQELNRSTYMRNDYATHASMMMMMRSDNANAVTVIGGRIQIRLGFDAAAAQLIVNILAASELPPKQEFSQPRSSFCTLYLLPDRSERSKRKTTTIHGTNEPRWDQTFVYSPVKKTDLNHRTLEITVYDFDRFGSHDLIGEVTVDLSTVPLDDEPQWYLLTSIDDPAAIAKRKAAAAAMQQQQQQQSTSQSDVASAATAATSSTASTPRDGGEDESLDSQPKPQPHHGQRGRKPPYSDRNYPPYDDHRGPSGEREERVSRGERPDRGDRNERGERNDRGERGERSERGERERGERGSRSGGRHSPSHHHHPHHHHHTYHPGGPPHPHMIPRHPRSRTRSPSGRGPRGPSNAPGSRSLSRTPYSRGREPLWDKKAGGKEGRVVSGGGGSGGGGSGEGGNGGVEAEKDATSTSSKSQRKNHTAAPPQHVVAAASPASSCPSSGDKDANSSSSTPSRRRRQLPQIPAGKPQTPKTQQQQHQAKTTTPASKNPQSILNPPQVKIEETP